jgi:hypothetical protein
MPSFRFRTLGSTVYSAMLIISPFTGANADKYTVPHVVASTEEPMGAKKGSRAKIRSRNGKRSVEVPAHLRDSIKETAEIEADGELMAKIAKSDRQIASGKVVSWKTVKAKLGL